VILKLTQLAAKVVAKASREHPADAVLRAEFKAAHGLARSDAGAVSRGVFVHFRWLGWTDESGSLEQRITQALEIAARFERSPASVSDSELLQKTIPEWAREQIEVSAAWVRTLQSNPKIWLRARPGRAGELALNLHAASAGSLPDAVLYEGEEDLFRIPEFHAGEFELQDITSQAVGFLCNPQSGETWWDACAGEGGKMLHLADLMQKKGLIWASDRAEWRLKRLKQRAARAKCFNYRAAVWDGGAKLPTKTKFDGVLVDAPCSGLGTWQRNPHARWTTTLADVLELADIQRKLLAHAAASVKPGGRLVYAVCTLARAETEEVASSFESAFPEFEPLPAPSPFTRTAEPQSRHWFWPQTHGGNGMFVALWRRKA